MYHYRVWFVFKNNFSDSTQNDGVWHRDFLDNNGEGFTNVEALQVAEDFNARDNIKSVEIEEMGTGVMSDLNMFKKILRLYNFI